MTYEEYKSTTGEVKQAAVNAHVKRGKKVITIGSREGIDIIDIERV